MCAIIFAAKEMEESWELGFDPTTDLIRTKNNVAGDTGRGLGPEVVDDQPAEMGKACGRSAE